MGYKFRIDPQSSSLRVTATGVMSFEDRLELLDEKLFLIAQNDIRQVFGDVSRMIPVNPDTDTIYFSQVWARHASRMNGAKVTLVLPGVAPVLTQALSIVKAAGLRISAYVPDWAPLGVGRALVGPGGSILVPELETPPVAKRKDIPFQVIPDPAGRTLYADFYGHATFADRLAAFERIWWHVRRYDIRHVLVDLSHLTDSNQETDELYFSEFLLRYGQRLKGLRIAVIHSASYKGSRIATSTLKGIGVDIQDFDVAPHLWRAF